MPYLVGFNSICGDQAIDFTGLAKISCSHLKYFIFLVLILEMLSFYYWYIFYFRVSTYYWYINQYELLLFLEQENIDYKGV